jgi:histidine triad (HIT) family protein
MASIFKRIIQGEIPCYKIAEDKDFFAFLDINPLSKGHTLVVPKEEVDYLFDLDEDIYIGLNLFAKKIATAIEKSVDCKRIGTAVIGLEVPHAHIHLVPINDIGDLNFSNPKLKLTDEEFKAIASKIQSNFK